MVRQVPDVMAAGGVVRRSSGGRVEVAIVRRSRHGGDRVLPKGHVERGETLESAAVREVREEVGCEATPIELAGVSSHDVPEGRKYVVYWLMDHVRDVPRVGDGEVEDVEWLPFEDALDRLTYPNERDVLRGAAEHLRARPSGRLRRVRRRLRRRGFQQARLATTLGLIDVRLTRRLADREPGAPVDGWLAEALDCIREARRALSEGSVDAGWEFVHRVDELELDALSDAELTARAQELAREAERPGKLIAWRAAAVRDTALAANERRSGRFVHAIEERRAFLQRALRVRNEGFNGDYRSLAIMRRHQLSLLLIAVVLLGTAAVVVGGHADALSGGAAGDALRDDWVVPAAMLLGGLGAVTSALQRSTRRRRHERIPEQLGAFLPSVSRPVIGAVAALTVYLTARVTDQDAVALVLVSAFGAGFSERLAVIAGDDRGGDSKEAKA